MDSQFWDDQSQQAYKATSQVLFDIFLAGGVVGSNLLPARVKALLDWDVFNQAALDYLELYRLDTVPNITATMRTQSMKYIDQWIKSGEPLPNLVSRLESVFGIPRGKKIAVTEVTRAYAGGNIAAWKSTGLVTQKVWQTANDERVCPICGPLHGTVVSIDGNFALDKMDLPAALQKVEPVYFQPPAHPNCRCYLKPIVSMASLRDRIREALNED